MASIKLRTQVGEDSILQVRLPPQMANQELDVVVTFQPVAEHSAAALAKTPEELGYSRTFLEEAIGKWEGEPLERPEQLPFEICEEIQWPIS